MNDLIKSYNELIEFCLNDMFEQTLIFSVVKQALLLKMRMSPEWMIESVGPFFFRFRERIEKHDIDYFINRDYSSQKEDWSKILPTNIIAGFEDNIRKSLKKVQTENSELMVSLCDRFLELYCKYVKLCKATLQ